MASAGPPHIQSADNIVADFDENGVGVHVILTNELEFKNSIRTIKINTDAMSILRDKIIELNQFAEESSLENETTILKLVHIMYSKALFNFQSYKILLQYYNFNKIV